MAATKKAAQKTINNPGMHDVNGLPDLMGLFYLLRNIPDHITVFLYLGIHFNPFGTVY